MGLTPRLDRLERNTIINGNFDFWQRGTSFTGITGNAIYHADRFNLTRGVGISSLINTVARSTDVPTLAQSGFQSAFSYSLTNTAAASNLATSGTSTGPTYHVEGNDIHRLIGKTVKLSFWVKSSVIGTYSFLFSRNFADNYVTTYTIDVANTWEKKTISVYIDPSVAWSTGNGRGLLLYWVLGAGTAVTTSSLNQWLVGTTLANANTATNTFSNTNGATFFLSQIMLTDADQSLDYFTRAGLTIEEELGMCQRYYEKSYSQATAPGIALGGVDADGAARGYTGGTGIFWHWVNFKVTKRAAPTMAYYNPNIGGTSTPLATDGSGNVTLVGVSTSDSGFSVERTGLANNTASRYHWSADSEL